MATRAADPLVNPSFRAPGFIERFLGAILGHERPLDCVQIEVSSVCVGGCAYCPQEAQKEIWKSRHMDPEVFACLWPLLRQSGRAHLQGWGEPLLHPRFFDFQALAARAGCATSTTSSGINMSGELARKLVHSGMDLIAFSITGTDAASNSIRSKIPFACVCQSIKTLRQAIKESGSKLEIHLAYLLLADRINAVEALPRLMEELDADMAVISTLDYLAAPAHREWAFTPDDTERVTRTRELLEKVAAEAESLGRIVHFALPGPDPVPEGCRENVAKCLYVDAEGFVSPCVYRNVPGSDPDDRRLVFGNVTATAPVTIWKNKAFCDFRQSLLAGRADAVCESCPKRHEW